MRTLISWLAYNNDFIKVGEGLVVNLSGPTIGFHEEYFEGYDRHILLSQSEKDGGRLKLLIDELQDRFPRRKIEPVYMEIRDEDVIDLKEIKDKVESFLSKLPSGEELDFFISPGTPTMQTAWYLIQISSGRAKHLWQTRRNKKNDKQERIEARVEVSASPYTAILSNLRAKERTEISDFYIPKTNLETYDRAKQAANAHGVPVLIHGETGTGKENLARTVYRESARRDNEFKAINCGALPDNLLESLLFGYVKGAFTGAEKATKGFFESAKGGTIFLDEIGDISPKMQVSLLRVLQESEILPVGANTPIKVDVRIVAATHRDLYALCVEGLFRWDLYYRLAVIELELKPLCAWKMEEKQNLLNHMAVREAMKLQSDARLNFTPRALNLILNYSFPGNIRELENLIRRLLVFPKDPIDVDDLPKSMTRPQTQGSLKMRDVEKAHFEKVLKMTNGNQAKANELMEYGSINRFRARMKEYQIEI